MLYYLYFHELNFGFPYLVRNVSHSQVSFEFDNEGGIVGGCFSTPKRMQHNHVLRGLLPSVPGKKERNILKYETTYICTCTYMKKSQQGEVNGWNIRILEQ
jgi:hypothetical protein